MANVKDLVSQFVNSKLNTIKQAFDPGVYNSPANIFWSGNGGQTLVNFQNSPVGKASLGLKSTFVNKPYEFGNQMGNDLQDIHQTASSLQQARIAPTFQYNPEGARNLLDQSKRALTFGSGIAGATNPGTVAAFAGLTGLIGGGVSKLQGANDYEAFKTGLNQAIESFPQSLNMAGIAKFTNPIIEDLSKGQSFIPRNLIKAPLNVVEGRIMNGSAGFENNWKNDIVNAMFPIVTDLGGMAFKSAGEALRTADSKIAQALGKKLRNNKGAYTTVEKFVRGTRPYYKTGRYASGALFGAEPYQDENGDWKIRFNPTKATIGIALMAGIDKAGKIGDEALKNADELGNAKPAPQGLGVKGSKEVLSKAKLQQNLEQPKLPDQVAGMPRVQEGKPNVLPQQTAGKAQLRQPNQETNIGLPQKMSTFDGIISPSKQKAQQELKDLMTYNDRLIREKGLSTGQAAKVNVKDGMKMLEKQASLEDLVKKQTDVKNKVGILDYLRTPDRVLKKIGLERQAVQLRQAHDKYITELPKEINRITDWFKQVPAPESSQRIFKRLDGQNVELNPAETKIAGEIKGYLGQWADRLNLPKEGRITNYITHIFDDQFIKKEFDEDLAKIIENQVAGSVYDPFTQQRLGKLGYKEDVWAALDAYVKRAVRKVNMDPALESVKEASKNLELSQFNFVKSYVDRVNMRPTEVDNLLDNTVKQLVGYKFGARPVARITRFGRQALYRGTLGLNVGSAVRNLTQGVNTYAKLGEKYTLTGYVNLLKKGTKELDEVGVLNSNMIEDRTLNATKKFWENTDKVLFSFFELAEKINRGSAYYGAKAKALAGGASEQEAIEFGKKIVRDTQFTFGSIDTPVGMQNDIVKLLTQFQSYNIKQLEFLGEMVKAKDVAGMARYAVGSLVVLGTIGKLIGMRPQELIPSVKIGSNESAMPAALNPAYQAGKIAITGKDEYGNELTPGQRIGQSASELIPYIPGGVQLKKTIGGIGDVARGFSQTQKGLVKFPVAQNPVNAIRGGAFGTNKLPEAQQYFNQKRSPLSENQSALYKGTTDKQNTYDQFMQKRQSDNEVQKVMDSLIKGKQLKPTSSENLPEGIVAVAGKYATLIDGEAKTFDTLDKAVLAQRKDKFRQSDQNILVEDDYVFTKDENGDVNTPKPRIDYDISLNTAKLTDFSNRDDFKGWVETATEQLKLLSQRYQSQTDPLEKLQTANRIATLSGQLAKYKSYGGFKKPKSMKAKKYTPKKYKKLKPIQIAPMTLSKAKFNLGKVPQVDLESLRNPSIPKTPKIG